MKLYTYRALKDKRLKKGEMEADSEDEIIRKLKEKNWEILSVKEKKSQTVLESKDIKKESILKGFGKVKDVDKVFLYKNFATMLKAGLPLPEVIDLLRESLDNEKLKNILKELKHDIETGNYISSSLEKHKDVFDTSEIAMLRAGEVGGSLPESFSSLHQDVESEYKLKKSVKKAMTYPVIILSILAFVAVVLLVFVLPQLTGFFTQSNIEIPATTKFTMALSEFVKKNIVLIVIFSVGAIVGLRVASKKSKGMKEFIDRATLKVPWVGKQFQMYYIHKIARMLALLIKSGVPILEALEIVEKSVMHIGYSGSVKTLREDVKSGKKLSESVRKFKDLYPTFVSRMLKVGDRSGNTAEVLLNISSYYREELEDALANISTLIEPILMVCLGIGVAFIAITVLIPLYSIVSGINQMKK